MVVELAFEPILIAVPAPAKLTVVATVLIKSNEVLSAWVTNEVFIVGLTLYMTTVPVPVESVIPEPPPAASVDVCHDSQV